MGQYLTAVDFASESLHPRAASIPTARVDSIIGSIEAQIKSKFTLDTSVTGFNDIMHEALLQAVEATINQIGGIKSKSQGRRSEAYIEDAVDKVLLHSLASVIKGTTGQLERIR